MLGKDKLKWWILFLKMSKKERHATAQPKNKHRPNNVCKSKGVQLKDAAQTEEENAQGHIAFVCARVCVLHMLSVDLSC